MIAGTEELEQQGLVEEVTDAVEEVVKAELAEVTAEVAEVADTVEEIAEEVEAVEEAVEEVTEAVEGLESMLNSGNYNPDAFAIIYASADRAANKIPGYRSQGGRLGAESIGDAATAQIMARNGMESMMDTVKGWAKKAADFIRAIFNSVINFFVGIFSQAKAIEMRADQLLKRLESAEIKEEVKLGSWNARLDIKKNGVKFPEAEITSLAEIATEVSNINTAIKESDNLGSVQALMKTLSAKMKNATSAGDMAKLNEDVKEGGRRVFSQKGALRLMVTYPEEIASEKLEDLTKALRKFSLKFNLVSDDAKKLVGGTEKTNAKKAELESMCKSAKGIAVGLRASKVEKTFSKAERDRAVGLIKAAANKDNKESNKEAITLIRTAYSVAAPIGTATTTEIGKWAKAALDCVGAHV